MKKMNAILSNKLKLNKANLEIGFFETAKYPNGTYVAQVARYQEFGTIHIPARPFFRRAVTSNANKWIEFYKKDVQKNNNSFLSLNKVGEIARKDIINSIDAMTTPPLKKSTIKQKGSSKPLVDTGLMRRSVTYKVKN